MAYWTIVDKDKAPVPPLDCNPDAEDEGMLVYRSQEATKIACARHYRVYGITCFPCELGKEK